DDEVGAVGERAPHLLAVHHPLVAGQLRAAPDRGDVGARAGLGEREGAQPLAARHSRKHLPSLGLAEARAHALAARADAREAHPALRFATRFVRRQLTTTSPRWFRPCVSQVTTPKAGRLSDSRFATTRLRAVTVSPG